MLFFSTFILLVCEFYCAAIGVRGFQDKGDSKTVQMCIFALRLGLHLSILHYCFELLLQVF